LVGRRAGAGDLTGLDIVAHAMDAARRHTRAVLARIAAAHGKSTAHVILRWHLQRGQIAIPKSTLGAVPKAVGGSSCVP
jgi:diketogulonate reductase-like aldo/keto reductase